MTITGKCGGKVISCDKDRFQVVQLETCTQVTLPLQPVLSVLATDIGVDASTTSAESRDIPWVPLDRDLFCCEKCFQVSCRMPYMYIRIEYF